MPELASTELAGTTVLVTGASRGLGRALALAFARAGARIVICARSPDALGETAAAARGAGAEVLARTVDVTGADAVHSLVAEAESRWGVIDTLVNNASLLGERVPLRDYPIDAWRAVLDTNLTGAFLAARAVLPGMRRVGAGSIVNITSGVGDEPRAGWGAYAVSKWAIEAFTYNLALEEKDAGIRVNAVDPGRMRTAMRRAAYPDEDPATLPDPADLTGVFLWLASDAASGVTGRRFEAQHGPGAAGTTPDGRR